MALFEVEVKQTSTVYYLVEASNEFEAQSAWSREDFQSEFVDEEQVVTVLKVDDRFEDDTPIKLDDYVDEEEDAFV